MWPLGVMEAGAIIGWNLRQLRVERGLLQERLALAAGIERAYVGRVERRSENVTITTLEAMASANRPGRRVAHGPGAGLTAPDATALGPSSQS